MGSAERKEKLAAKLGRSAPRRMDIPYWRIREVECWLDQFHEPQTQSNTGRYLAPIVRAISQGRGFDKEEWKRVILDCNPTWNFTWPGENLSKERRFSGK